MAKLALPRDLEACKDHFHFTGPRLRDSSLELQGFDLLHQSLTCCLKEYTVEQVQYHLYQTATLLTRIYSQSHEDALTAH